MDSLPDELLEMVFSQLSPSDLLGAVPVVCRRWRDVARSKAAWRNAAVDTRNLDEDDLNRRVLRLAPALDKLTMSCNGIGSRTSNEALLDCILSGVPEVKRLQVINVFEHEAAYGEALRVLEKFKDSVVEFFIRTQYLGRLFDRLGEIIASMPRLESLVLELTHRGERISEAYTGWLGRGCPSIKRFVFHGIWISLEDDPRAVLFDVLRSAGPRLTHLELDHRWDYFSTDPVGQQAFNCQLQEELRACPNLHSIDLNYSSISLVRHLSLLQSLKIDFSSMSYPYLKDAATFIRRSPVIANITKLRMVCPRGDGEVPVAVVSAIGASCTNLRVLEVRFSEIVPYLEVLRPALSKLECLYLDGWCTVMLWENLKFIAELPSLRVFKFSLHVRRDDTNAFRDTIAYFREKRPSLRVLQVV